ncbi:MAG: NAD-dependent alcohol dehydrogenase, partial [Cetobacterium sp.]
PTVMEYNALADNGRYEIIYNYIREDRGVVTNFRTEMLIEELKKLNRDLKIPSSLSEVGVTEDMIPEMAKDAMKSGNIAANPRQTNINDIMDLYKKAL